MAASFVNFGKPMTIVYRMCLGRTGWKIADVTDGEGAWRLRAVLKLPANVRCSVDIFGRAVEACGGGASMLRAGDGARPTGEHHEVRAADL